MANSELYDKTYKIPNEILNFIQKVLYSAPNGDGVKRAKFMIKNGTITYQSLKRLKNFFDYFDKENDNILQYNLAGGDMMKEFVEGTLNADRSAVESGKKIKQDIHANPNSELMPYQAPNLNEEKNNITRNAIAVIVNADNKILLLKRADNKDYWMPNKWSLVGGGVEKGDKSPTDACKREILEETGLEINNLVEIFTIKREKSVEYLFAGRYNGDSTEIILDKNENVSYGWYSVGEIEYLDTVPHLIEYIVMTFKKYE